MSDALYERWSARVLLVDATDRVLLFKCQLSTGHYREGICWLTPGGGIDDGEDLAVAAARELYEETGLSIAAGDLGSPVAATCGYAELGWASGTFRDDFFFYRVSSHDVDTGGLDQVERDMILGHHWWTVDDLASTAEVVFPYGLVPLLRDLIAGRIPAQPVRLPWHHPPTA